MLPRKTGCQRVQAWLHACVVGEIVVSETISFIHKGAIIVFPAFEVGGFFHKCEPLCISKQVFCLGLRHLKLTLVIWTN